MAGHAPPVRVDSPWCRAPPARLPRTAPHRSACRRDWCVLPHSPAPGPGWGLTFGPWPADDTRSTLARWTSEFTGFAGDCIITGRFALEAKRLTDQLNAVTVVPLEDVVLDGLDGHRVTTPAFQIDRAELCAVVGRGPVAVGRCASPRNGDDSRSRSVRTSSSAATTGHSARQACAASPNATRWCR